MAVVDGDVLLGGHLNGLTKLRAKDFADGQDPGDLMTVRQGEALFQNIKNFSVDYASTGSITISAPGATVDGGSPANGETILLKDQATKTENGVYVFNGATSALTRHPLVNTAEALEGLVVLVDAGTANGGKKWRQTQTGLTLGTSDLIFSPTDTGSPPASTTTAGVQKNATAAQTQAGTAEDLSVTPKGLAAALFKSKNLDFGVVDQKVYTLDHNLGTENFICSVRQKTGSKRTIIVSDYDRTTTQVKVSIEPAPTVANSLVFSAIATEVV